MGGDGDHPFGSFNECSYHDLARLGWRRTPDTSGEEDVGVRKLTPTYVLRA